MKKSTSSEFIYQLFSLLISIIVIHAIYVTVIRPKAVEALNQQAIAQQSVNPPPAQRSIYVVLKDFEQETCFILMLWALLIMAYKARLTLVERAMLLQSKLNIPPGVRILPDDAQDLCRPLQNLAPTQQDMFAPRTLLIALQRFSATANVAAVATAVKNNCESETDKLDSELAMVRYIVWAIPSIGFIGTVRGIGDALGLAHEAVQGNIVGVTNSLGIAFNSTFIALVISIFIMFFSHQLQLMQERLVQNTQDYCDNNLLNHLLMPSTAKEVEHE